MHFVEGEEGRFELALSTSVLNELKYGSQLGRLAESLLLSAFNNNSVELGLQREIAATLPSVKYISLAAFLNGGVVVRSSNLAVEGDVAVRAQAMGQSAARVAARQHSIFHGQKKPGEAIKYQELQEAWDQQQCTSTVSVPIPASRHFEDAFIPYHDRHKPAPDRGTCPVLYVANGTIGVIHFGLSTADVKLNGRQGKQFVGLAQSLGPHLGYLIGPALDALSAQIQTVAASNAQQQHLRRRSISCSLPPVETLTLHDSAGSLSTPSGQPAAPQQQTSSRQTQPPLPGQPPRQRSANALPPQQPQAGSRMLSPFQTYTAAAAASQQPSSPEGAPGEQSEAAPDQPGSDRLDLSPAKTALDMSMLEIARLHAGSPAPVQPPLIHEAVRRVSSGHLARHSAKSGEVSPGADAAVHGREMDLEYQPSIEAPPRGSSSFDMGRGKGKGYRRPPMPMLRASSPLSAYGSEPSSHLPTQLSIPGLSGSGRYSQQAEQQGAPDAGSPMALPFAARPSGRTPFACVPPSHPTQAGQTSSCMQAPGSIISLSQVLPGMLHTSQAPSAGPWQQQQPQQQSQLSPSAVASLAASLPPQLSNSAMAVLSAPMSSSMPPSPYSRSLAALSMPSLLPRSGSGMLGRPPQQQSRGILPPTAYQEAQPQQPHLDQLGYRLPTQLQSASLLLQLLPAGSAQSLTQLMSRAASGAPVEFDPQEPAAMARSSSLSNDNSTSVSVGSPKRSLLDMSRAVSEQLHLTSAGKGVQRPFLADLQQRWTAGHQGSGVLRFQDDLGTSTAGP